MIIYFEFDNELATTAPIDRTSHELQEAAVALGNNQERGDEAEMHQGEDEADEVLAQDRILKVKN